MARVHKIEHARKDYSEHGIAKGDTYYKWSLKTGPYSSRDYKSKTYPDRRQLTLNAFKLSLYDLEDQRDGIDATTPEDLESARDELATAIRELADEQQEKLDNMPEGLQQGSSGETLQSRIDGLNSWADEVEALEIPDWSEDEAETDDEETREDELADLIEELKSFEYSGD